jgi:hypothetical protein
MREWAGSLQLLTGPYDLHNKHLGFIKGGNLLDQLSDYHLLKKGRVPRNLLYVYMLFVLSADVCIVFVYKT